MILSIGKGAEPIFSSTLGSQIADIPSVAGVIGSARPTLMAPGSGSSLPPPLPQRLSSTYMQSSPRYMNNYSSFGMSGYPYNSFNGYGGYGGYGGYPRRIGSHGMGYGGYQDDYDSFMMQSIDESCATLFGPFDSLVRSISSIAMVLDSTHQAMQFSFRTVLSAADSLSKLKNMFVEFASSFSIIRLIQTLYYKVLRLLGLISGKTMIEKQWAEVFNKAGSSTNPTETNMSGKPSPWLALGFFSLMMGGPYLMFKLFAQNIKTNKPKNGLIVGPDSVEATVAYDFEAGSPQELSMKRGERLKVSRTSTQGWALATNGIDTGYVPTNRLQPVHMNIQRSYPPIDQRKYFAQPSGMGNTPVVAANNMPQTTVTSKPLDLSSELVSAPSEKAEETQL